MIDKTLLTEDEIISLKMIALTHQKEKLEKEIAEMKQNNKTKAKTEDLIKYFQD